MKKKNIYQQKVEWMFKQFPAFQKIGGRAYNPTINNTKRLVDYLGIPIDEMKFVHVAGTNGKGTTCSIIASVLTESGIKTGLFTSPHILDFRERIRINGKMISKEAVIKYISIFQETTFNFSPSFFEMTWVMALDFFYREKCDKIVVETGLGGRLDATNIIVPEVSIITNIGLDHIDILGSTVEEIAFEKAGIIKSNIPVYIGENTPKTATVFLQKASLEKAPIVFMESKEEATFNSNKRLAFEVVDFLLNGVKNLDEIKEKSIQNLYKNTGWFGRHQIISETPLIIFDVGHNKEGIKRLIQDIFREYPEKKVRVLYGSSSNKDIHSIISLLPTNWEYFFTEFKSERSEKIQQFKEVEGIERLNVRFFENAKTAYSEAKIFGDKINLLIVFGSFFLLSDILS